MDAAMIGQIEKAILYAQEPGRVKIHNFEVKFEGNHSTHTLIYQNEDWQCDCHVYQTRGLCSHVMTLEKLLGNWVEYASVPENGYDATMIGQIDKSRQYAQDRERSHFDNLSASVKGTHHDHQVVYAEEKWTCDCHIAETRGVCSHIMTLERILAGSIEYAQATPVPA